MKKLCLLLMASVFLGCQAPTPTSDPATDITSAHGSLTVNEQTFTVELADTDAQRQRGLMEREQLAPMHGMLFVFESADFHGFWMKNTLIPLDVIWISTEKKIVDIKTLAPCLTNLDCPVFEPAAEATYVLEVNAQTFSGKIGDFITLSLP